MKKINFNDAWLFKKEISSIVVEFTEGNSAVETMVTLGRDVPSPKTRPSLINLPETFPRVSSNKLLLGYQVCFLGCGPAKVGIQAFSPLFI